MKQRIIECYDQDDLEKFLILFREKFSKLMRTRDDYKNKSVSVHNMTMKELSKIFLYMMKDVKKRKKYINALSLENEDIKSLIACYCLRCGIYRIKSRRILRKINKTTKNPLLEFSTEMSLKQYNLFYRGKFEEED